MDGCVFFGLDRQSGQDHAIGTIRTSLERLGITRAVAVSLSGIQHHYAAGNEETLKATAEHADYFLPLGVVNAQSFLPGTGIMESIADRGFPIVGIFPGWPDTLSMELDGRLTALTYAAIFREADAAGLPILAGLHDRRDLVELTQLAQSVAVPVLFRWMSSVGYVLIPDLIEMCRAAPNLIVEVSCAQQTGAIELLVETLGAHRLFMGSGAPLFYEACPMFLVLGADISELQKRQIISGTLSALFSQPAPASVKYEIFERLNAMPKTDTLWHSKTVGIVNTYDDPTALADLAGRWGINTVVLSSFDAIFGRMDPGNRELADFVAAQSGFWGLVAVHPREAAGSLRELEKYADNPNMVGVKLLQDTGYGMSLDDHELMDPIFAAMRRLAPDWTILAHPPGLTVAAERNPDITFVCEHAVWRYQELGHLDNVYYDITTSTTDRRINDLAPFLMAVPPDRLLYSTDSPMIDPAVMTAKLACSGLDLERHAPMFHENARQAFPRIASTESADHAR